MADKTLRFNISAQLLKHIINLQKITTNEGKIVFDKEKIVLSNVDPAHVLMITQNIPIQVLNEYNINDTVELGFDYDKLIHILKGITKSDNLVFTLDSEKNRGNIQIKGCFNHLCGFIDTAGMPDPKQPNLELPSNFVINTKLFYDFLIQAERITDYVSIETTRDSLILFAEGDVDEVKIELTRSELKSFYSQRNFKSLFSIDYLLNAFKNLKNLFSDVDISIGDDNPIQIIGDNETRVKVLLAPRIEED